MIYLTAVVNLSLLIRRFDAFYNFFLEMWLHTFYAVALSSIGMHIFAVITCLFTLMKHSKGRWYSILLIINAVFFPLIVGLISSGESQSFSLSLKSKLFSAIIAGVYFVLDWSMESFVVIIWGMGQVSLL